MFRSRTIRHLTVRTAAVVSLLLLPVSLSAQRSGAFDDARLGDGELERGGGETYALVEGAATLRPDGTAWIVVRSRDERFELRGEWQQGDREQRLLTIYQAMGGIAAAEGWLMSQNGRLKQIELVGRWGGGRRLRLHFLATADLPPRAPVWGGVDSTRPGDGVLDLARSPRPVRRLRVVLDADGSAELVLSPDDFRLVGRWSRESATQVRFDADGGLSGEPGIGSGTIDLRDGEVERVTLVGRSARSDYRLDFAAAPPPPPPRRRSRRGPTARSSRSCSATPSTGATTPPTASRRCANARRSAAATSAAAPSPTTCAHRSAIRRSAPAASSTARRP